MRVWQAAQMSRRSGLVAAWRRRRRQAGGEERGCRCLLAVHATAQSSIPLQRALHPRNRQPDCLLNSGSGGEAASVAVAG